MVTIGNVDQVMALVRNQLERMARDRKVGLAGSKAAKAETGKAGAASTGKTRLQALNSLADLPAEEFDRVLVGALLSHEFGEDVAQDPRFKAIVDRTAQLMRDDPELAAAMREVRAGLAG